MEGSVRKWRGVRKVQGRACVRTVRKEGKGAGSSTLFRQYRAANAAFSLLRHARPGGGRATQRAWAASARAAASNPLTMDSRPHRPRPGRPTASAPTKAAGSRAAPWPTRLR